MQINALKKEIEAHAAELQSSLFYPLLETQALFKKSDCLLKRGTSFWRASVPSMI